MLQEWGRMNKQTLIDRVKHTTTKLTIASNNDRNDLDIKEVRTRLEILTDISDRFRLQYSFYNSISAYEDQSVNIVISFRDWQVIFSSFMNSYLDANRDIKSVDPEALKQLRRGANSFFSQAKEKLQDAWTSLCEDIVEVKNLADLETLEQIEANKSYVTKIKSLLNTVEELSSDLPENFDVAVKKLKDINTVLVATMEKLDTSGLDPSVQKFLRAIRDRNCTLFEVDENVLSWLRKNNASRKYRVQAQLW